LQAEKMGGCRTAVVRSIPGCGGIRKKDVTAIPRGGKGGGVLDKDKIRRGGKSEQGLKEVKQPREHPEAKQVLNK
jgi:hypothetical protein